MLLSALLLDHPRSSVPAAAEAAPQSGGGLARTRFPRPSLLRLHPLRLPRATQATPRQKAAPWAHRRSLTIHHAVAHAMPTHAAPPEAVRPAQRDSVWAYRAGWGGGGVAGVRGGAVAAAWLRRGACCAHRWRHADVGGTRALAHSLCTAQALGVDRAAVRGLSGGRECTQLRRACDGGEPPPPPTHTHAHTPPLQALPVVPAHDAQPAAKFGCACAPWAAGRHARLGECAGRGKESGGPTRQHRPDAPAGAPAVALGVGNADGRCRRVQLAGGSAGGGGWGGGQGRGAGRSLAACAAGGRAAFRRRAPPPLPLPNVLCTTVLSFSTTR